MKFLAMCAVGLLLAVAAFWTSCSDDGGGTLSLDEYFQQLDEAQNEVDQRFEEQEEGPSPDPEASEEELAAFGKESFQESVDILRDAGEAAADLEPPDEVEQPHNDLVDGIEAATDALQGVADDFPDAISLAELESGEFFDAPELDTAFMQVDEACFALQQVADDNNIDVDLECGE